MLNFYAFLSFAFILPVYLCPIVRGFRGKDMKRSAYATWLLFFAWALMADIVIPGVASWHLGEEAEAQLMPNNSSIFPAAVTGWFFGMLFHGFGDLLRWLSNPLINHFKKEPEHN